MTSAPTVEYDEEARRSTFGFLQPRSTTPYRLSDSVYVDIDVEGETVGIEILHATPTDLPNLAAADGAISLKELLKPQAA